MAGVASPDLTSLDRRVAEIIPRASDERWLKIPWRTDLLRARQDAHDTGRPIFMWLMDGDPLGCT